MGRRREGVSEREREGNKKDQQKDPDECERGEYGEINTRLEVERGDARSDLIDERRQASSLRIHFTRWT